MLAGLEGLDHQRAMGPALGENGDGVHIGSEHGVKVVDDAVQVLLFHKCGRALRQDVGDDNAADAGVQLEKLGKLAGELAGSDKAEGNGHRKAFLR